MNLELEPDEILSVLATVVANEATEGIMQRAGEEPSADERIEQIRMHNIGHKLAELAGVDYHAAVRSAVKATLNDMIREGLGL